MEFQKYIEDEDGRRIPLIQLMGSLIEDTNPIPSKITASNIAVPAELYYKNTKINMSSDYGAVMNVAASGSVTYTITPPVGEIWRLKMLRVKIPLIAASTGNHTLYIRQGASTLDGSLMSCVIAGTADLSLLYNCFQGTVVSAAPSTAEGQIRLIQGIVVTSECPLYVVYNNGTGTTQAGTSVIKLIKEVEYYGV
jgi:hypothetical protein